MPFKNPDPLYSVWQSMRRRCLTPTSKQFNDYGGRGITICRAWDSFERFKADMGPRPPGTSLDREDNNGNYEPSNCRWATRKEQQRNQRRAVYVTIEGQRYRAIELAERSGWKTDTIVARAKLGMTLDQVLSSKHHVNPANIRAAVQKRVANQLAATHCKRGHAWIPENTRYNTKGQRYCRLCDNENARALRARDVADATPSSPSPASS